MKKNIIIGLLVILNLFSLYIAKDSNDITQENIKTVEVLTHDLKIIKDNQKEIQKQLNKIKTLIEKKKN